jgi:hypothetical protein
VLIIIVGAHRVCARVFKGLGRHCGRQLHVDNYYWGEPSVRPCFLKDWADTAVGPYMLITIVGRTVCVPVFLKDCADTAVGPYMLITIVGRTVCAPLFG